MIRELVARLRPAAASIAPSHREFRRGDVRHSLAAIDKARRVLGYAPAYSVRSGLARTLAWYAAAEPRWRTRAAALGDIPLEQPR